MTKSSTETGSGPAASDPAPRGDEPSTSSQRERRRRILDATLALAAKGGYEAVQMRAVAEKAEVAVGTLYRYFPSKVHLLVSALAREFRRLDQRTERSAPPGDTAQERMKVVVDMITKSMQRDPNLTEAMTRAFMFADASVANEVEEVGFYMDRIIARAMAQGEPDEVQLSIARVVSDVWMSNLVSWLTRRSSAADVNSRLGLTIDLLLGTDDSPRRARLHTAIGKGNGASEENGVSEENAEAGAEPGA
ncbi:MAG: cholesterol catabolism transcriptional regulator KstR [Dietzia sp.]|uniref:Cholesterol catabolism transcriptional regulator KstR n=1 Tax=Dietzia cercidiphylli TaxID=498199 RepID=A0ABN2IEI2_9ACTN|nr:MULTISPECIES: cholesterol catabolism transcriptional regulator KstR [Dietzia]MBB1041753.1 cholesterol catabolism transcriptional regulator KstR [Dietzia sp. Cai40]MBB1047954.1 cholesterol catabolism transcriptional regulator KstR [Dietzia cercidiphylli]MBB1051840.1 cholesterol catabolism transcriptional regulator KstR [Dietzia sp. CW19]MBB1055096.1 cholesterol catabolism transcriptional regulator KstR [Dietzia sp. B44]MBB1058469.1 cholesterol catabolism transcriptional regulator KstR [Dietz